MLLDNVKREKSKQNLLKKGKPIYENTKQINKILNKYDVYNL